MPGKLNSGHARYEEDCRKCHSSFKKNAPQRLLCLDCHKKVAKDIDEKTGFHGRNSKIEQNECNHCHTEHKGRSFDIMVFDRDLFNHEITDFLLKGRHA
ncbi:MAG: cytochrome c3 family protein, partial [Nitrospinota bacterium]